MVLYARANNTVYCSMGLNSWGLMVHRYFGCCCSYNFCLLFKLRSFHFSFCVFFFFLHFVHLSLSLCELPSYSLVICICHNKYINISGITISLFSLVIEPFAYSHIWKCEWVSEWTWAYFIFWNKEHLFQASQQYFEFRFVYWKQSKKIFLCFCTWFNVIHFRKFVFVWVVEWRKMKGKFSSNPWHTVTSGIAEN